MFKLVLEKAEEPEIKLPTSAAAAAAAKSLQSCPNLCDPMDCSLPGSSVHGISRQEYWSGVPLPSPRIKGTKAKSQKDYKPLPRDLVGKGDPPGEEHLKGISFAFSEEFWTISCFIH